MWDGFYELELARDKKEWERVRWQTCILVNIHKLYIHYYIYIYILIFNIRKQSQKYT